MGLSVFDKLRGTWDVILNRYDREAQTELGRFQGRIFAELHDHGALRHMWRNEGRIAPDLYRSNHPNERVLAQWAARGVRDVVSLRPAKGAVHVFEAEACERLGLRLTNVPMAARAAPHPSAILQLLVVFDRLELPALIHCKSGADRTGLAAAFWHIHKNGMPVSEARTHLSLRHLHLSWSNTGVLDRVLDAYAAEGEAKGLTLKEWAEDVYDPARI